MSNDPVWLVFVAGVPWGWGGGGGGVESPKLLFKANIVWNGNKLGAVPWVSSFSMLVKRDDWRAGNGDPDWSRDWDWVCKFGGKKGLSNGESTNFWWGGVLREPGRCGDWIFIQIQKNLLEFCMKQCFSWLSSCWSYTWRNLLWLLPPPQLPLLPIGCLTPPPDGAFVLWSFDTRSLKAFFPIIIDIKSYTAMQSKQWNEAISDFPISPLYNV